MLTLSRIAAAPVIGYLVFQDQNAWALGLLAYAGVSDLLDGWIARQWNRRTVIGTVIDPMADKLLMTALTVALAAKGALPRTSSPRPPPPLLPHHRCSAEPTGFLLPAETSNRWLTNVSTAPRSLGREHHPRPRRRPRHLGPLLPLDLPPGPQDLRPLLGLLAPLGGGHADHHQQV